MKEEHKKIVRELSEKLARTSFNRINQNVDNDTNLGEVIDVILSAHVTSMINLINKISEGHGIDDEIKKLSDGILNWFDYVENINLKH